MSTKNDAVFSTEIVPEVLIIKKNYKEWSFRLRTYLMAQDVWDVIESTSNEDVYDKVWQRKNATALHAIHISCGPDAFSLIEGIPEAKGAWNKLAEAEPEPEPELKCGPETEVIISHDFYEYVRRGDRHATNELIARNPGVVNARITYSGRTALHVAAIYGHIGIVETLVDKMSENSLEIQDAQGFTALAISIQCKASIKIAECMVKKNNRILGIHVNGMLPVVLAFLYGHVELGRYLYTVTPLQYLVLPSNCGKDGATLIAMAIYMQSFEVAWDLLNLHPLLAVTPGCSGLTPIFAMANRPSAFRSGCRLRFWEEWIYNHIHIDRARAIDDFRLKLDNIPQLTTKMCNIRSPGLKYIYDMKLAHVQILALLDQICFMTRNLNDDRKKDRALLYDALCRAVDRGNVELIKRLLDKNPELVEKSFDSDRNIFMRAILHRQANVFNLIHGLDSKLKVATAIDRDGNNMLHMTGLLLPYCPQIVRISGPALQMQRELQWFQAVESIVPPWATEQRNSDLMTPAETFGKYHEKLMTEGEKWMKDTATSFTIVGALIITIMFAAAFTVPGGNNEDTGLPVFLNKKLFMVFIISDAISLFFSTTSVLMFVGILTSSYAMKDFLKSLPKKMMIGLSTLFVSIAAMMIAFCATLLIVLREYPWIFIPLISLAIFPIVLSARMQFSLLVEIFVSTYRADIIYGNVKIRI